MSETAMVKWGVLGTAGIAKGCTIPGMKLAKNCELFAVAGRNLDKANQFKEEFGFKKAYGSYEELLADDEVQAVYIPLPNDLHSEWVIKSINAGKHVLCEKPLTPTVKEAEDLYNLAEEKGVILMEAFAYLHNPYVAAIKEEVKSGILGKIKYVETAFITSDYNMSNIRMNKETFGGSVYDLGCYCTSMILSVLGKEPVDIKGFAEFSNEKVDKFASVLMNFEDDVRASFNCGMIFETEGDRRFDRLYIHGENGYIKSDVEYNQEGELSYTVCVNGKSEVKKVFAPQNYSLEVTQLGKCITDGEKPFVSKEFTLMNLRVLTKALEVIGY